MSAYSQVGVETGVTAADPHRKLILMLFDGALLCVTSAAGSTWTRQNVGPKGENISKAINIIANGLKASLNMEVGGELAERLAALYDYMCEQLLLANIKNNSALLDEVHDLLDELKGAWENIAEVHHGRHGHSRQPPDPKGKT
ncbi:MAG: flagellar export chaperone FliS [Comamonadaceae bacterium]|nr:flagellar export chaperone FliS [Comamonadaceae bacterium]